MATSLERVFRQVKQFITKKAEPPPEIVTVNEGQNSYNTLVKFVNNPPLGFYTEYIDKPYIRPDERERVIKARLMLSDRDLDLFTTESRQFLNAAAYTTVTSEIHLNPNLEGISIKFFDYNGRQPLFYLGEEQHPTLTNTDQVLYEENIDGVKTTNQKNALDHTIFNTVANAINKDIMIHL